MRSRFSAFALGLERYLLDSWDPSTRPDAVELDGDLEWRRLQIVDTALGGPSDDVGVVEFRASFRENGKPGLLQERSRFARAGGRWVYVDGDVHPS
jgi:SEC-C motif-containing protein